MIMRKRIRLYLACFLVPLLSVIVLWDLAHLFNNRPMYENTAKFSKHYDFSFHWPFITPYFVLSPENYDSDKDYPVVLALHGVSKYVYGAYQISNEVFQKTYPAFVVVPIIPKRARWSDPQDQKFNQGIEGLIKLDNYIPVAVGIIKSLQSEYSIDEDRVYVTGHSMGGAGVYGALKNYPDIFAAGLSVSGYWSVREVDGHLIRKPIRAVHGRRDTQIPYIVASGVIDKINDKGGDASMIPYSGGHRIGNEVYSRSSHWDWMFRQ